METLSRFLPPVSLEPASDLSCWRVSWIVGSILLLLEDSEAGNCGGGAADGLEDVMLLSSSSCALAQLSRLFVAEAGEADTEG